MNDKPSFKVDSDQAVRSSSLPGMTPTKVSTLIITLDQNAAVSQFPTKGLANVLLF